MTESGARLLLDYLKALIWPVIFILAFLFAKSDLMDILRSREVEFAGVRIGQRVEQVQANVETELSEIRAMIEELRTAGGAAAPQATEQIVKKVDSLSRNLNREISQIQRYAVQSTADAVKLSVGDQQKLAAQREQEGFDALLKRDLEAAIRAFVQAEDAWPEYHNVSEIHQLLTAYERDFSRTQDERSRSELWNKLYSTLLTQYSWGMPTDTQRQIKSALSDARPR